MLLCLFGEKGAETPAWNRQIRAGGLPGDPIQDVSLVTPLSGQQGGQPPG